MFNNSVCGIRLQTCNGCIVCDNILAWNGVANAYDQSGDNQWDFGGIGNAHSDCSGTPPYLISADSGERAVDRYPRVYPPETSLTGATSQTGATLSDQVMITMAIAGAAAACTVIVIILYRGRPQQHQTDLG